MALGTGQLSLGDIAGEYGGSAPHALSEYYSKGNAPSSGEIQIHADFNGTANVFAFAISSNASQVNLRTLAVNAGWDQSSPVSATINSGVIIYSGSTGSYAMVINGTWSGGVTLTNNGTILGKGGNGAKGSFANGCSTQGCYCSSGVTKTNAGSGGPALQISSAVTIVNANGRIAGGGGGGGGGSSFHTFGAPGGGGGGGIGSGSAGGSHGGAGGGSAGSLTAAGSGGSGYVGAACGGNTSGAGGAGGSYGASGANGAIQQNAASQHYQGTAGGSAGAATSGQSNVTWTSTGTRNGSVG